MGKVDWRALMNKVIKFRFPGKGEYFTGRATVGPQSLLTAARLFLMLRMKETPSDNLEHQRKYRVKNCGPPQEGKARYVIWSTE
jgi:hypothetical protein